MEEAEGKDLRELQEERLQLSSLLEHPGFKLFREFLQGQVQVRTNAIILKPLDALDEVPRQEYAKGEAAGIDFAVRFIDARLSDLNETIAEILAKKEQEDEEDLESGM